MGLGGGMGLGGVWDEGVMGGFGVRKWGLRVGWGWFKLGLMGINGVQDGIKGAQTGIKGAQTGIKGVQTEIKGIKDFKLGIKGFKLGLMGFKLGLMGINGVQGGMKGD